jgi:hypothetical protein
MADDRQLHVYKGHQRVDSFETGYRNETINDELVIRDATGAEVKRYAKGDWHAAGVGVACGFVDDDPACATCHPL